MASTKKSIFPDVVLIEKSSFFPLRDDWEFSIVKNKNVELESFANFHSKAIRIPPGPWGEYLNNTF